MPPIDPDAPWWANLALIGLVLVIVPVVTGWLTNRKTRRTLERVAVDARTSAEQTANNHADAEHPNLRDELTAVLGVARDAAAAAQSAAAATERVERFVRDVDTSVRALGHSVERHRAISDQNLADAVEDRNRALEELREEIPTLIAQGVEQHVSSCPLRSPGDT